jgi:hypothetical protein
MIKMVSEECHFRTIQLSVTIFSFNEKRKGFSLYRLCDDRITCFDKGTRFFTCTTLSCSRSKLTSYKRTLRTSIQHEPHNRTTDQ